MIGNLFALVFSPVRCFCKNSSCLCNPGRKATMCCAKCGVTQRKLWVFGSGIAVGCIALTLVLLWPDWGQGILDSELVIKEGSLMYKNWIETPIPIRLEFRFFNWTNADKIQILDEKPHFKECGPYVFLEKHKRVNLTWNANGTISYNQTRVWQFDATRSKSLEDVITAINPVSATVANLLKDQSALVKAVINIMLNDKGGSIAIKKTVKEFLFDGYDDPLLTFLKKFNSTAIDIPYGKFGWFVDRNNSYAHDGRFTMYTGQNQPESLGLITLWNSKNETGFYDGDCGKIHGTSGELWPPKMDPMSPKTIFVPDLCRSLTLKFNERFEKFGIEGSQWIADAELFDNGHLYQENRCFCLESNFSLCPPTGVLDVSRCQFGAPAAMSFPHFYLADPSYLDSVSGLKPNKSLHKFTVALETKTGIPLDLAARVQLNMHLRGDKSFDIYNINRSVLIPVMWFGQIVNLNSDLASDVKLALMIPHLGVYISYGLFGAASLIITVGIILTLTKWSRRAIACDENISS